MSVTDTNPYPQIKAYERVEFDRLTSYLEAFDPAGWVEQSYCTDWRVYQVVSHIASGSRIGGMRVKQWVTNSPPMPREAMLNVWAHFDSLQPDQMLGAYKDAAQEYLSVEAETPDEAGLQEVDGFAGRRPIAAYQVSRVWELACHSWDTYVGRDRTSRLHPQAVALLAPRLDQMFLPLDKERSQALSLKAIVFTLQDSGARYTLDPSAERPRLQAGAAADAPLVLEGPDEEITRFISGRHFVPGAQPALKMVKGTPENLAALRRAFR